ncbi:dihydrofolate reductase family protein [Leptospira bandrabouensis]|uniref:dihydrofolate reductase family protein n=1 Tax=Leptospira bandrabouensis TaxID=2484903 RepID=UPI00223D6967|nr:dihydrofolate reductase family protein [Leptospira bandrabouensis]MCW7458975.1 dihydrofolate reductase family protein [Leptospira bandrabouensis]MCW7478043.1 dihydrofolate reductase family protein [Leptospira bandrabouensis]MCW7485835.1 dihydrofolate reductase family protein [Leptospira bandrabouensis]
MRKIIAAINMTLDGFCDHTSGIADKEIHQHYADLLRTADAALYGRITYQLMEYWRTVLEKPTDDPEMNDFAIAIDGTPKIVFSRTLKNLDWKSAKLATRDLNSEVLELKQQVGKNVFVCSPSLILALTKAKLIDEFQLCVHPIIAGSGLVLFEDIKEKINLHLTDTKRFGCGAVILYYKPKHLG